MLVDACPEPVRRVDGPFVFAVDHCFPIKGQVPCARTSDLQGTVMTGTVLSGTVQPNDTVDIPALKVPEATLLFLFVRTVLQIIY